MLAKSQKAATYKGKLIVADNGGARCLILHDSEVDEIVAENRPFSSYKHSAFTGPPLQYIQFDDSTPVTLADTISYDEVPDDAESSFVLEPAFIMTV